MLYLPTMYVYCIYIAHEICDDFSAVRPYIVKDRATLCFKCRLILVVLYMRSKISRSKKYILYFVYM